MKKTTALIILDGFGYSERKEGNAVFSADVKNFDRLYSEYPHTLLSASGKAVGLPEGQIGNSEVGHLNIGGGRIVVQVLDKIEAALLDKSFYVNKTFLEAVENCKHNNSALHIMGLLSSGGVHSRISHLFALLEVIKAQGLSRVYIHCFMDGRDTAPTSGRDFLKELEDKLKELGIGKIATVSGRYYAMDRDKNYDRTQKAYDAMVLGKGSVFATADEAISASYKAGLTDEHMLPAIIEGSETIQDGDSIIFFNYRPDRARQIMKAFIFDDSEFVAEFAMEKAKDPAFKGTMIEREKRIIVFIAAMTQYEKSIDSRMFIAFDRDTCNNTLGEYLSKKGYRQFRTAETEKFAHVTSFFNGSIEDPFPGEDVLCIPSPKVKTFDLKPEMSAYEVTESCIQHIESGEYDFVVVNFANPDMVGHTGNFDAVVKALNAVDECLGNLVDTILKAGGKCCITADHGNCDEMIDPVTGEVATKHSLNPVPFILVDDTYKAAALRENGSLRDIAPTLLQMMGLKKPKEMTGASLIID